MCRAAPARVIRIDGETGYVLEEGHELAVSLLGLDEIRVGDYVYCHAGLALERIEPEEAGEILRALNELETLMSQDWLPGGRME